MPNDRINLKIDDVPWSERQSATFDEITVVLDHAVDSSTSQSTDATRFKLSFVFSVNPRSRRSEEAYLLRSSSISFHFFKTFFDDALYSWSKLSHSIVNICSLPTAPWSRILWTLMMHRMLIRESVMAKCRSNESSLHLLQLYRPIHCDFKVIRFLYHSSHSSYVAIVIGFFAQ